MIENPHPSWPIHSPKENNPTTRSLNPRNVLVALALMLGAPGAVLAQAPLRALGGTDAPAPSIGHVEDSDLSEPRLAPGRTLLPRPLPLQAQEGRKSGAAAFGLELIVPTLGHAYAGDWKRGVLPAVFSVGGYVGLLAQADDDGFVGDGAGAYLALGALLGGRIWGLVSAVGTANDHNRSLSSGNASVTLLPTPGGGLGVGMALRF